jgi:long-chain acyl-CoA synthetase
MPVNAGLHPVEVAWIIDNAQARWAFVSRDGAPDPLPRLARRVSGPPPRREG